MPLMGNQALEQILLERRREAIQGDHVFTHVRMDTKRDVRSRLADAVKRGQRDEHVVADASDVHRQAVRRFFGQRAFQSGDHGR